MWKKTNAKEQDKTGNHDDDTEINTTYYLNQERSKIRTTIMKIKSQIGHATYENF